MFRLKSKAGLRGGEIMTKSGVFKTPLFLPDATRGFARSLAGSDLKKAGIGALMVNTYHLYLQPGVEIIKKSGGIHRFMGWSDFICSDSGGYQVFSLIHKNPRLGRITSEKVIFKSPLDGKNYELTPEKVIEIQFDLGVDAMVVLDDCPPNHYPYEEIEKSVERTIKWAKRCKEEYNRQLEVRGERWEVRPLLFGVIQGGTHKDLRKQCAEELIKIGFDGLGFGARHHNENGEIMENLLGYVADLIPENYLRFALGVGTPADIIKCAGLGWDLFDCVIPTREGRHGRLFVSRLSRHPHPALRATLSPSGERGFGGEGYETININNEKYKNDFSPVDENCGCELCRSYSRAYLRHLFSCRDPLAMRLAAAHNLNFFSQLFQALRKQTV